MTKKMWLKTSSDKDAAAIDLAGPPNWRFPLDSKGYIFFKSLTKRSMENNVCEIAHLNEYAHARGHVDFFTSHNYREM